MADVSTEDKEKAEKLAAAKKKYEQLKKQKAKGAGATTKGKKSTTTTSKEASATEEGGAATDEPSVDETVASTEEPSVRVEDTTTEADAEPQEDGAASALPSISEQSKLRSESFRRGDASSITPPPASSSEAVQEIYRKQAARIEALERENKQLEKNLEAKSQALGKTEAEVEEGWEAKGAVAGLRAKAERVDKLESEMASLQRQNAQLQSASRHGRRSTSMAISPTSATAANASSGSGDYFNLQLAQKTTTIENLELEISNLRHAQSTAQSQADELTARNASLETEIATLRSSLASTSAATESTTTDPTPTLRATIARLEADLAAQTTATATATSRAETLKKKIDALTTLHRESEQRAQSQVVSRAKELERLRAENGDMRKRLAVVSNENARLRENRARAGSTASSSARPGSSDSAGASADSGDATKLLNRVRDLEAENTELRRGLRASLSARAEAGDDEALLAASPNGGERSFFDEVDLNAITPSSERRRGSFGVSAGGGSSAYAGLSSMWSAFTGGGLTSPAPDDPHHHSRRRSSRGAGGFGGFFSGTDNDAGTGDHDDLESMPELDEDAFRAAHEEELVMKRRAEEEEREAKRKREEDEQKARLERVRELKRGLNQWVGWRVDLVQVRGGSMAGVFDI